MAKQDPTPMYPCMAPPPNARFVHEPHDERRVASTSWLSRLAARLRARRR